jgi:hypothetical protein
MDSKTPWIIIILVFLGMKGIETLFSWIANLHAWLIEGPLGSIFSWLY